MSLQPHKKSITVEIYHQMIEHGILGPVDRIELIEGDFIYTTAIGSYHAAVVDRLNRLLLRALDDQAIIRVQNPVWLNDFSELEPDLSVLKLHADFYADAHPKPADIFMIAEVSDSTLEYDRNKKKSLYALARIPEFWLINLKDQQIEVYKTPKKGMYLHSKVYAWDEALRFEAFQLNILAKDVFGKKNL